jgi:hypothetical protein
MITKGERIPFDVSASRTIEYDLTDFDNVELVKEELAKQARNIESKGSEMTDNPVTPSLGIKLLKEVPILASKVWPSYLKWSVIFAIG